LEIPFERNLETLDITGIAEWDVLAFLHRHGNDYREYRAHGAPYRL
jgi:hypothetical protein